MRRALFAASLICLPMTGPAMAAGFSIAMDEVHTVTFKNPVATVYVGNPSIADINMIDSRHAFVIGKAFGNTNIVALDSDGKQVFDAHIAVQSGNTDSGSTLVLNRGTQRVTYNCTASHCEATPEPGDGKDSFDALNAQLGAHSDTARKAAGGG